MADDRSVPFPGEWPLPKFSFQVEWNSEKVSFQEVSGLDIEDESMAYRHGGKLVSSTIKMSGIKQYGHVIMKKGILKSDNKFWDWFNQVKTNTIKRETVTIKLLDESGVPTMTWTLKNAWPIKITGADVKSTGNEVAIETMEFTHEGITVVNS